MSQEFKKVKGMIKKVTIEEINTPERFLEVPLLTKNEVEQAIDQLGHDSRVHSRTDS